MKKKYLLYNLSKTLKKLMFLSCILITANMFATDIYVNSTTGNDLTGNGTSGSPYLTITKAIEMASANDTLYLQGIFTGEGADINGIIINKNLSIYGEGIDQTYIEASSTAFDNTINKRTITINPSVTVLLKDLTIRHGYINTSQNYDGGGGIKSSGLLTINKCKITKNGTHTSNYQQGAGILIAGTGKLTISNSIISYNQNFGPNGWGGGMMYGDYNSPQALVMNNTTFHDNISTSRGGAMLIMITNGTNEITNCTFFNNTGTAYHCIFNDRSPSIFTNNTIVGNSGGIFQYANSITLKNNILADNVSYDFSYQSGTVIDNGFNIVEVSNNYTFTESTDFTGNQPSLNISTSLADNNTNNGTPTLALLTGSIAIDAGGSGTNGTINVPTLDQRGYSANSARDIGAFEYDGLLLNLDYLDKAKITFFPNPTKDYIQFSGINTKKEFIIYNELGVTVKKGLISNNEKIDISILSSGIYFVNLSNDNIIKFIKN